MYSIDKIIQVANKLGGKQLTDVQRQCISAILTSCDKHGVKMDKQVAYILATGWHEARFKPVEEGGKGKGLPYGSKLKRGGGPGKRIPYTQPDQVYYGRGCPSQITWYENYEAFSKVLGIDLLNHPELALQPEYGAEIGVIGMKNGMFTGHSLGQFFNDKITDPVEAREIVNGHDEAVKIADYYTEFLNALA